jgi:hypothetical protein
MGVCDGAEIGEVHPMAKNKISETFITLKNWFMVITPFRFLVVPL